MDDNHLILLVQQGNKEAFEALVKKYSQKLYSMAYRMLANQQEAEDIVQEAFVKLWTCPHKWVQKENVQFKTWFYRLVINACIDYSRKKKNDYLPDNFDFVAPTNLEDNYDSKMKQEHIEKLLNELPINQKTALNLCFYEGLSNQAAADIMQLNLKALQSLIMRAKEKLKKKVKL